MVFEGVSFPFATDYIKLTAADHTVTITILAHFNADRTISVAVHRAGKSERTLLLPQVDTFNMTRVKIEKMAFEQNVLATVLKCVFGKPVVRK